MMGLDQALQLAGLPGVFRGRLKVTNFKRGGNARFLSDPGYGYSVPARADAHQNILGNYLSLEHIKHLKSLYLAGRKIQSALELNKKTTVI